jgi:hypothetical protein
MNVLDENIRHDQGEQLRKWRIKFRRLVVDIEDPGHQRSRSYSCPATSPQADLLYS